MSNIPRSELTLKSVEFFGNKLESKGKSQNTVKAYKADLTEYFRWLGEPYISASDFSDSAEVWLNKFRRIVSPKTTGRRLTSLRSFARWAGIPDPLDGYSAPVPARAIAHPLPEGMAGIYAMLERVAEDKQKSALIALCGLVGARVSEALSVGPSSFDLTDMLLTIRGKGDKTRVVPLSEAAFSIIAPCLLEATVVSRPALVQYHDRFARKVITDTAASIPLARHVSSHDLRATFATALNDAGVNLRVIQEILGHESSTTTEGYTLVRTTQMKDAVALL